MLAKRLKKVVQQNSLLWGADVAADYHGAAALGMEEQWEGVIKPALQRHPIDYTDTFDFACGYGRNTDFLLTLAGRVTMIDVNSHNVEYCKDKYRGNDKVSIVQCNGYDLRQLEPESATFLYTFDSMVHFPKDIIKSYLPEFLRVLRRGGFAFIHHSNYTLGGPKKDFRENPHWRNYMSAEIFCDIAKRSGFNIEEQTVIPWDLPELDCITILSKP
jgi:ubiquinone/menaquinone biosynthesis C-methylase UbiE